MEGDSDNAPVLTLKQMGIIEKIKELLENIAEARIGKKKHESPDQALVK
jgi:hypothetical protein